MTFKVKIREAEKTDIPILAQHNQALANETENIELSTKTILSGVSKALDREDCHYFVAELNGEVVGQTMITYEWSDWRNGLFWWIQSVFIDQQHRRKGVFGKLYQRVTELAKEQPDACGIRLYVERENTNAQKTYHALGMIETEYNLLEVEF